MVTGFSRRQDSDPAISDPLTSIPDMSRLIPLGFSPMIKLDEDGMVMRPRVKGTDASSKI